MWGRIKRRKDTYGELLHPSWRWLVAVPIALAGALALVRDEIVVPKHPDDWKPAAWLPDWPWEWYGLVLCAVAIALVLESGHRAFAKRDAEIQRLKDQYKDALHVVDINYPPFGDDLTHYYFFRGRPQKHRPARDQCLSQKT